MSNFLEKLHLASQEKAPKHLVLGLFFLAAGTMAGYYKAKAQAKLEDCEFTDPVLKEYISEDKINAEIDRTLKPAVIYYYQPGAPYHYQLRQGFLQSSNRCHEKASFYMVNLTKKLLPAEH